MHKSSALTELTVQQGETGDKRTHICAVWYMVGQCYGEDESREGGSGARWVIRSTKHGMSGICYLK